MYHSESRNFEDTSNKTLCKLTHAIIFLLAPNENVFLGSNEYQDVGFAAADNKVNCVCI